MDAVELNKDLKKYNTSNLYYPKDIKDIINTLACCYCGHSQKIEKIGISISNYLSCDCKCKYGTGFVCVICCKSYNTETKLKTHVKMVHAGALHDYCYVCSKKFKKELNLYDKTEYLIHIHSHFITDEILNLYNNQSVDN